MGWVSPTGGSGTNWTNVERAYDDNESSYAQATPGVGWTGWIELTRSPLLCDKIRFKAFYHPTLVMAVSVEVYYEDAYHPNYIGEFLDRTWVEKDVIPGDLTPFIVPLRIGVSSVN